MYNFRQLLLASMLVFALIFYAIINLTIGDLSAYGSIISAGASLLAVIWFSGGLWHQSEQLKEQRKQLNEQRIQFTAEFNQLKKSEQRDSLLLAKSILELIESRSLGFVKEITSINELSSCYLNSPELKIILESSDPSKVFDAYLIWSKKEAAATTFLRGIKSAAEIVLNNSEDNTFDYSKSPEDFLMSYGASIWKNPFFDVYEGPASILSQILTTTEPMRKACHLASMAATSKLFGVEFLKMNKIKADLIEHLNNGYKIPKIAVDL